MAVAVALTATAVAVATEMHMAVVAVASAVGVAVRHAPHHLAGEDGTSIEALREAGTLTCLAETDVLLDAMTGDADRQADPPLGQAGLAHVLAHRVQVGDADPATMFVKDLDPPSEEKTTTVLLVGARPRVTGAHLHPSVGGTRRLEVGLLTGGGGPGRGRLLVHATDLYPGPEVHHHEGDDPEAGAGAGAEVPAEAEADAD